MLTPATEKREQGDLPTEKRERETSLDITQQRRANSSLRYNNNHV
jgi:hypothetical protein